MKIEEMAEKYASGRLEGSTAYFGFRDGANAVLEEIEELVNTGNWLAFPRQNITELRNKIKKLKGI